MMLSWVEITERALSFAHEWQDAKDEHAQAQTFWNEFFSIFGVPLRRVAVFEKQVALLGGKRGSIDLFWKGTLIAEHKSRGKNLDTAYWQAMDYVGGLSDEELPRYIIVSDFQRFRLYDLDVDNSWSFNLSELPRNIHLFGFMIGRPPPPPDNEEVNIKAAELMGQLHDALKANGYVGHMLELLLVRFMFCLFADDTGIFDKGHFAYYIEQRTREDGADVGAQLSYIFQLLNTPEEQRPTNLDEDAARFQYINGSLFDETLPIATFDKKTRDKLLKCCYFDWSNVSPAVFGSLFQAVVEPQERRDFGVHYTSERNILKVIKPLFLDGLYKEFEAKKRNKRALNELLGKIGSMKFLDPACGCGSFLVVAYKELRRLELEIHKQLQRLEGKNDRYRGTVLDVVEVFNRDINVDSFYGIDLFEFPVRIAEVALWLTDHQANIELQNEFGLYFVRLPLISAPHIVQGNALTLNWEDVLPKANCSYIFGNPPFVGTHFRSDVQNDDMAAVFSGKVERYKNLDYVCSWYVKALEYVKGTSLEVAFVSTNSITQGEQVAFLWEYLLAQGARINFAHRSFHWSNLARGKAGVTVIIIGFATYERERKQLFEYVGVSDEPIETHPAHINPYLVDAENILIKTRKTPLCDAPRIVKGNIPVDGSFLLLTDKDKLEYLEKEPDGAQYIYPFISAKEFLYNVKRWCFWLPNVDPAELRRLPLLRQRLAKVREFRLSSRKEATRRYADKPYLFMERRQPTDTYLAVPEVSSENRRYIPLAFLAPNVITNSKVRMVEGASLYHFGVLQSAMHMAWARQVCGRLRRDFQYSNDIVYNNFPWAENPQLQGVHAVSDAAQAVLSVRERYPNASLADLYDPLATPKDLLAAHKKLDKAVDRCYRREAFKTDSERLHFLFERYAALTASEAKVVEA
ncbi:MAG: DNA methyltransferase [Halobacteriota archaeon]